MKQKIYFVFLFSLFSFASLFAQQPEKPSAVEIYHAIQKLNLLRFGALYRGSSG